MDVIHQLPHSSVVPYFSFGQGKAENDSEVVAGCEDNIQVFPSQASLHHAINIGCFIPPSCPVPVQNQLHEILTWYRSQHNKPPQPNSS